MQFLLRLLLFVCCYLLREMNSVSRPSDKKNVAAAAVAHCVVRQSSGKYWNFLHFFKGHLIYLTCVYSCTLTMVSLMVVLEPLERMEWEKYEQRGGNVQQHIRHNLSNIFSFFFSLFLVVCLWVCECVWWFGVFFRGKLHTFSEKKLFLIIWRWICRIWKSFFFHLLPCFMGSYLSSIFRVFLLFVVIFSISFPLCYFRFFFSFTSTAVRPNDRH